MAVAVAVAVVVAVAVAVAVAVWAARVHARAAHRCIESMCLSCSVGPRSTAKALITRSDPSVKKRENWRATQGEGVGVGRGWAGRGGAGRRRGGAAGRRGERSRVGEAARERDA